MCWYAYSFSILFDANSNEPLLSFVNIFLSRVLPLIYTSFIEQRKVIFTSHHQETFITTPSFLCNLELCGSPRGYFIRLDFFSKRLVHVSQWLWAPYSYHARQGHNKTLEKDWYGLGRSGQQVTPSTTSNAHGV